MPRDPSSTPCEKAIPEPHIHHISQVSISSYIRSGYKSKRPLPWTRYSNIYLPCRGAPRFSTRSITLAGHTFTPFWGQCPASEDQHVAPLPRLSREVPASLHPKHSGVLGPSPAALRVVASRVDTSTASDGQHDPTVPPC